MWKRREMSRPSLTEWGEPEFVWWPYVLMVVCFIIGFVLGKIT